MVVAASVAGSAPSQSVPVAVPRGEIVFASNAGLYRMAPDGSHVRLLFRGAITAAAASHNGRWIAYTRGREIWVMKRDGSHRHLVATIGGIRSVALSPDGRIIYFDRGVTRPHLDPGAAVFTIHTDGTGLRRLTRGGCETDPAPSPDGRIVAYTSMVGSRSLDCVEGRSGAIYAVTKAGRPAPLPFRFPDDSAWEYTPVWSPDGRRLAYYVMRPEAGVYETYVSLSDGSRPRRAPIRDAALPSWSADSAWIAFARNNGIWLARQDWTGLRQLTHGADDSVVDWLPSD